MSRRRCGERPRELDQLASLGGLERDPRVVGIVELRLAELEAAEHEVRLVTPVRAKPLARDGADVPGEAKVVEHRRFGREILYEVARRVVAFEQPRQLSGRTGRPQDLFGADARVHRGLGAPLEELELAFVAFGQELERDAERLELLAPGVVPRRVVGRDEREGNALFHVRERCAAMVVASERGGLRRSGKPAQLLLERGRDRTMHANLPARVELLNEGVAEQRVRERVLVEGIGGPHDARFERGVDRVQRLVLSDAGDIGRDPERERDLEQCSRRQQPVRRI